MGCGASASSGDAPPAQQPVAQQQQNWAPPAASSGPSGTGSTLAAKLTAASTQATLTGTASTSLLAPTPLPVPVSCHPHVLLPFDNGSTTWYCNGKSKACTRDSEGPSARWKSQQEDYDLCRGCVEHYRIKAMCNNGHVLIALGTTRDNGWNCDASKEPAGCLQGVTAGWQSQGKNRFRCRECDFDLCEQCWAKRAGTASTVSIGAAFSVATAASKVKAAGAGIAAASSATCQKGHALCALGTSRDNGWECDGRYAPGGCLSGITGYGQSQGLNRYRCDSCDYDLCEKCAAAQAAKKPADAPEVDEGPECVVKMDQVPAHWDMSVMQQVKMGLGLRPKDGSNRNLVGRVKLKREEISELQALVSATFRKVYTRDRKGGKVPSQLELLHGVRVQNAMNWIEYVDRTEVVKEHLDKLKTEGNPGVCPRGHVLKPLGTSRDDGWCCAASKEEGGCESGITARGQTTGKNRFRCEACDYDLCEKCYVMHTGQKLCKKGHVLVPLGTSRETTWHCDGRDNPGGCKRGLKEQSDMSKGVNRFRCAECDWDLCDLCYQCHMGHVNNNVGELKTEGHLMNRPEYILDQEPNCVWLFHGTSDEAAECITSGDFLVDKAGSNAGTLYGRGIYLAESCSKADEYTKENGNGERCLLLCRATLGNVLYNCEATPNVDRLVRQCKKGAYHSVLGDREKLRGTFREFIVYDDDQVYPEFILWYRRVYV